MKETVFHIQVRLQTMPKPKKGEEPMYKGAIDCMKKTIRKEVFIFCYLLDDNQFYCLGFFVSLSRCGFDVHRYY
jgi:hypothetical protein